MARDLKSLGAAFHASPTGPIDDGARDDLDEVSRAIDAEKDAAIDEAVQAELGTARPAEAPAPPEISPARSRRRAPTRPDGNARIKTSVSLPVGTAQLLRSAAAEFGVSIDGMLMRMYLDVNELLEPTRQNEELVALGIVPARRPRGEPTVVMSISLTPEAAKRLDDLAARLGQSRSATVDRVVRTARPNAQPV